MLYVADHKNKKVIQLLVQDIDHVRLTLAHTTLRKCLSDQMPVSQYAPFSLFTEKNIIGVLSENYKHFLGDCCIASYSPMFKGASLEAKQSQDPALEKEWHSLLKTHVLVSA